MTLAARQPAPVYGHAKPRIAPPVPARSDVKSFEAEAKAIGVSLMPWQHTAARYLTALGRQKVDGRQVHLYREVCIVVARQNGKTTLMKPLIIRALKAGKRVMHIAQTRELPRQMFGLVAANIDEALLPKRRGKAGRMVTIWPRYGSGQEEIVLNNGGSYRIAASTSGGARGWTNDLVIIDELREMDTFDIISAAEPTLTMSPDPQMVYLSNAGDESSVVLNAVRERAGKDETLAYLEWSAHPERGMDDIAGWAEANPALGHFPSVLRTLEAGYRKHALANTLAIFETEQLCRWVPTTREKLTAAEAWRACYDAELEDAAGRPSLGICMDPQGARASAAIAWPRTDGTIGLRLLFDVPGHPIDTDRLGRDLRATARKLLVNTVGFDPLTDAVLAKFFVRTEPIAGAKYANASARFVAALETGKLKWRDAHAVGEDLEWTARKPHDESGSFQAVRAQDDRPITAALAAIRAVWLASTPRRDTGVRRPPAVMGF